MSETERRKAETWSLAGLALAIYFAQDPVVHDFLIDWQRRDDEGHSFAVLLYSGRFRSKAADEIRIASLPAGNTAHAVAAAKGLALSGTDAALAALVANLDRRDFALLTIVEAIATYGIRAKPHLDSLLHLREELEAHVADEDDLRALDSWRKQSITETITDLATTFSSIRGRAGTATTVWRFCYMLAALEAKQPTRYTLQPWKAETPVLPWLPPRDSRCREAMRDWSPW